MTGQYWTPDLTIDWPEKDWCRHIEIALLRTTAADGAYVIDPFHEDTALWWSNSPVGRTVFVK